MIVILKKTHIIVENLRTQKDKGRATLGTNESPSTAPLAVSSEPDETLAPGPSRPQSRNSFRRSHWSNRETRGSRESSARSTFSYRDAGGSELTEILAILQRLEAENTQIKASL